MHLSRKLSLALTYYAHTIQVCIGILLHCVVILIYSFSRSSFFHTNMSLSIKPFNMYRHVDVFDHKTWARTGLLVVPFYPKYAVTCVGPAPATIIRWGMCRWWLVKTTVAFNIGIYQYQIHLVRIFRISTPCSML